MSNHFHFITPVWGDRYTDWFLQATLPSQLSEGNLGVIAEDARNNRSKYKIYTTIKDVVPIKRSPVYRRLTQLVPTEVHFIDDLLDDVGKGKYNKLDVLTLCHFRGIEAAAAADAAAVLLSADIILSDGTFAFFSKCLKQGKRAVVIGGFQVTSESFLPEVRERFYSGPELCLRLPPRELVRLSMAHIHPSSRTHFVASAAHRNEWPCWLFWEVPGEGVLQRGIHLAPVMLKAGDGNLKLDLSHSETLAGTTMAIDGSDFIERAVPDLSDIHVVEDSDEVYAVSLEIRCSPGVPPQPFRMLDTASWISQNCSPYHVKYLQYRLRYHCSELSAQWQSSEAASDKVVNSIIECLDLLQRVPELRHEIDLHRNQETERFLQLHTLTVGSMNFRLEAAQTLCRLGEELSNAERLAEAEAAFQRALILAPESAQARTRLAAIHNRARIPGKPFRL